MSALKGWQKEDDFLNSVEKYAREQLASKPMFGVWRRRIEQRPGTRSFECDTVMVGLLDEATPSEPSAILFLQVYADKGFAHIDFKDPRDDSGMFVQNPFSNDPGPKDVAEFLAVLASFSL